ncbi:MAG: DUF2442 domain-containing protein [Tannerella sp.]|jgi:hypothetical protein|nr:DUF2442 domain-containing protein [Tannerella sp.]
MEGLIGLRPELKSISFERGKMRLHLKDGRIVIVPLSYFPSIKKLTASQRTHWQIIDNMGFTFIDCNEVYHIEQVLGKEKDYKFTC